MFKHLYTDIILDHSRVNVQIIIRVTVTVYSNNYNNFLLHSTSSSIRLMGQDERPSCVVVRCQETN